MFINGNLHAHNMAEDVMDEWTKNEDELAAMRCAHTCWRVGCQEGVEIALTFHYHEVVETPRTRTEVWHATPWSFWCSKHGDEMGGFDDDVGQFHQHMVIRFHTEEE